MVLLTVEWALLLITTTSSKLAAGLQEKQTAGYHRDGN